ADFEKLITPETSAIVCTHASNLLGTKLDLVRIGQIAKAHNLLLIVDASQTAGAANIDIEAMNIDILCFTGHKGLMGPQGTGGLCVRDGLTLRPFKVGGSGIQSYNKHQPVEFPSCLEAGTLNGHGIAGLSAALDYLEEVTVEAIEAKEHALMMRFYEGVSKIEGVTVYGDFTQPRTAIVTLNIRDYDSSMVSDALSEDYGIATRAGAHCAPRLHQALGTTAQGAIRFSISWFNTEEEIDEAIRAVAELAVEE
ncbi:MAG: aminotransferase class V-fold PLP-dependent enzyme, partial [Clostridia bacterium]|nr:aminotransferase class V-fold PLP-dependent enzyme [Clostridia bacterium]